MRGLQVGTKRSALFNIMIRYCCAFQQIQDKSIKSVFKYFIQGVIAFKSVGNARHCVGLLCFGFSIIVVQGRSGYRSRQENLVEIRHEWFCLFF